MSEEEDGPWRLDRVEATAGLLLVVGGAGGRADRSLVSPPLLSWTSSFILTVSSSPSLASLVNSSHWTESWHLSCSPERNARSRESAIALPRPARASSSFGKAQTHPTVATVLWQLKLVLRLVKLSRSACGKTPVLHKPDSYRRGSLLSALSPRMISIAEALTMGGTKSFSSMLAFG